MLLQFVLWRPHMADDESASAAAGFKEMYCDNDGLGGKLAGKGSLQEQVTRHMTQIFECLTEARLSSSTPYSSNELVVCHCVSSIVLITCNAGKEGPQHNNGWTQPWWRIGFSFCF